MPTNQCFRAILRKSMAALLAYQRFYFKGYRGIGPRKQTSLNCRREIWQLEKKCLVFVRVEWPSHTRIPLLRKCSDFTTYVLYKTTAGRKSSIAPNGPQHNGFQRFSNEPAILLTINISVVIS